MIRLKRERLLQEKSQAEVAAKAGLFTSEVSRIETGRINPTADELQRLGRVLGCKPERLMDLVSEPEDGSRG